MNTGMPDRASWNDFPEVLIHASESTVKKHPDYPAAKAGDIRAAKLLVVATLNDKLVAPIKEQLGGSNALLVPVHAYEATGINRIPAVLAEVLGEWLSLKVAEDIIQVNRVGHTGALGIIGWHSRRSLTARWSVAGIMSWWMISWGKVEHWPICADTSRARVASLSCPPH